MIPVYRSMDSHPNQRNQMPFSQFYYPNFEVVPPHMKMDSSRSPVMFESWPCGSNYGHSVPCHASCNHNNFPAYYYTFRPSCPHFSPAPNDYHFCGNYPTFPEAYSVHYVPPPHYSMAQPRYEYDEDAPRNYHCCGCPNHTHGIESEKGVKIEEQEPEAEKKGSDTLVPIQLKNYPYPIVWIPPEYMKNKESIESLLNQRADQSKVLHDTKIPESLKPSEQEPRVWNGQFPFDMNSLKSLMQGEDGKRTQNQQSEDKMREFPTPIIWMPSYNKQEEVEKKDNNEMNAAPKSVEESPNFKFTPAKLPDNDGSMNKLRANEEKSGSQVGTKMVEEHSNQKNIPVKQMEAPREKNNTEDTERRERSVSVKHVEDTAADKLSGTSTKRQSSSSPPKASKLPPACLRVDPLPRRKNGNGSSRSPSPPGSKGQSQETAKDTSKASASSGLKEYSLHDKQANDDTLKKSKEVEPNKKERKNVEVVVRRTSENKDEDLRSGPQGPIPVSLPVNSQEEVSRKPTTERKGKGGDECKIGGGAGHVRDMTAEEATKAKEATDSTASADGECKPKRKNLSDVEAAVLIQSGYRGFEVRRWEPLKKLKQIAKVREQMFQVRNRIQTLESSSDLQIDDRQRVIIGEMIMSLLLNLDTIQGLHPSLRGIRKNLARELVTLQGKLDSLMTKKSKRSIEEASTAKPTNDLSVDTKSDVSTLEMQNKEASLVGGNQPESNYDSSSKMKEKERDQDQLLHITDVVSDSQGKEISETQSVDNEVHGTYENEIKEIPVASGAECQVAEQTSIMESKDEVGNGESNDTQQVITVIPEGIDVSTELEQSVQHPSVVGGNTCSEGKPEAAKMNATPTNDYQEVNKLYELPQGVIREESGVSESDKNEEIGKEAVHGEVESNLLNDLTSPTEVDNLMPNNKVAELNLLEELPIEVIDEGNAVSLFQKHEHIETERDEVPQSGGGESNVSVDAISPTDKAPAVSQLEQQSLESSDWVKVGSQTDEELTAVDTALEVEVEEPQGKEFNNDDELSVVAQETQQVFLGKENSDGYIEEKQNMNEVDHILSSESAAWGVDTQVKGVLFEEKQKEIVDQPLAIGKKEEVQEKKLECQEPEVMSNDKMSNLSVEFETAGEVGTQSSAVHEDQGEEEGELLGLSSLSPSASQVSLDEHNIWMEREKKLIEENAKLRKMMEKLMEVEKNQLNVISSLTGRVKDLERKWSRKKKLKTRHHRKGTSAISCAKPLNDTVKGRAVGVAM